MNESFLRIPSQNNIEKLTINSNENTNNKLVGETTIQNLTTTLRNLTV